MKLQLIDYLTFFIFVVGLIALARWRTVDTRFHPFLVLILLGCANDALSYLLVANGYQTLVNNNVYLLLESLLLLWFFQKVGVLRRRLNLLLLAAVAFVGIWISEVAAAGITKRYCVYFSISYTLVTVLMSIATINNLLNHPERPILKNALFLICIGFISFYTLNILVKAFWLYGSSKSNNFLLNIYFIMLLVNFVTNIIYAIAILLMPRRPALSLAVPNR